MKKLTSIFTVVLYFAQSLAFGQNNVAGYQYWFDTNFTQSVSTAISPTPSYNLNTNIATTGLPPGIHAFSIRFWDDSLRYSSIISSFFLKTQQQTSSTQNITGYQFWFDNNFANATTQSITPSAHYNLSGNIDASALAAGIHTISFRFQHSDDSWSSIISQFFLKTNPQTATSSHIVGYEYWFDTNFTTAVNTTVPATQQLSLVSALSTSTLPDGIHTFSIRFKHSDGNWSSVLSQFFLKRPAQNTSSNDITEYQFWFDTNFTTATTQTVTATQQLNLMSNINATALPNGIHTFSIRFKHSDGNWSSVISKFFLKRPPTSSTSNKMVSYRYWFDTNFVNATYVQISPIANQVSILDALDMTQIPKGMHQVSLQFKDSVDMWSVITVDSIMKESLPVANFSYSQVDYCDSTVVQFTDLSIDGDVYHWDFGDGDTSNLANPTHTYFAPGVYTVSQIVADPIAGLDSTFTLTITIDTSTTFAAISTVNCDNYTSPSGNYTWLVSGTYQDTIANAAGCDSVLTINLTILQSTSATLNPVVCDEYISPSGQTWLSTGLYQDTIANTAGCDSLITINLTVLNSTSATLTETACFSYVSPSGNMVWTSSGTYFDTIQNSYGCDSVVTVNLTINTVDTLVNESGFTLTANSSTGVYQWIDCNDMQPLNGENGQSFTATISGDYAVEIQDNGCTDTSSCHAIVNVGIVENYLGGEIVVYPNPTSGNISIKIPDDLGEVTVLIWNVNGVLVNQFTVNQTSKIEVEINGASGLYFIEINSGKGKARLAVVKQ